MKVRYWFLNAIVASYSLTAESAAIPRKGDTVDIVGFEHGLRVHEVVWKVGIGCFPLVDVILWRE